MGTEVPTFLRFALVGTHRRDRAVKRLLAIAVLLGPLALLPAQPAAAVECANGVYRAGCAGPNGAAVVRKPVAPRGQVNCASGPYRAGCAGPNGAAVVRR